MAAQQVGTGFSNLSNILNANKQNQLGGAIQNGIQGAATQTTNDLNNSQSQFNTDVNNANLNTDANKQQITSTINNITGPSNQTASTMGGANSGLETPSSTPLDQNGYTAGTNTTSTPAASNNGGYSPSAGDVNAFAKFRSGTYNGPSQLNNYSTIQGEAANAQQLGQDTRNIGGQQALLQQFVGHPGYTQGEQGLDTMLLGQTGAPQLQAAQRLTQGLSNQVGQAGSNASNQASMTAAGNQALANFTNQQLQNALNPLSQQVQSNLTSDQAVEAAREAAYQKMISPLTQNPAIGLDANATPDQINANNLALGLSGLNNLSNSGLISNVGGPATANSNPIAGLQQQYSGMTPIDKFMDPATGQYVTQKPNGQYTYDGGPKNGQQYIPPGSGPSPSDLASWQTLLQNSNKWNNSPGKAAINYNQDISQALTDTQAQNLNAAGVTTADQAARINALNQLGGQAKTYGDMSQVGNYQAGSDSFNQAQALNAIQSITNPNATPIPTVSPGADQGATGPTAWLQNAGTDATKGNYGGAVGNFASGIFSEPGALIGNNAVGNTLTGLGSDVANVGQGIGNAVNNITGGGGGGGKIICNELHRQGYISDKVIALDEAYGRKYRHYYREAYLGYLTVASPIVTALRLYPWLCPLMMIVTKPWSQYMANVMDKSIPGSKVGWVIHQIGIRILPIVYKIKIWKSKKLQIVKN